MNFGSVRLVARQYGADLWRAYWLLIRIMVPALICVRVLELLGVTGLLAWGLEPAMSSLGLPSEFGLVWAAAMLTNIYTAMVVFYELSAGEVYSVAQMSVLGILILISHALPVEGAVARLLHVSWGLTLSLRVVGAYVLAWGTHQLAQLGGFGAETAQLIWQPSLRAEGWVAWCYEQLNLLVSVLVILAVLMAAMRVLRALGFERLMAVLLWPLIKIMNVQRNAASITIIGLMLGLSFGAGLLVDAARSGELSKRDIKVVACFLGLCHSIIEDTLLIMLLGADIIPILLGRFVFSCLVIAWLARTVLPAQPTIARST